MITAAPLVAALLAAGPAAFPGSVEVAAQDEPELARTIARLLEADGLRAAAAPAASSCPDAAADCATLLVRRGASGMFALEARRAGATALARVALPSRSTAFEQAHALALRARALLEQLRPPPPPAPPRPAAPAHRADRQPPPPPQAPLPAEKIAPPAAPEEAPAEKRVEAPRSMPAPQEEAPIPRAPPPLPPAETRAPLHLSLGASALALGGRASDVIALGAALHLRAALGDWAALRLSGAWLAPGSGRDAQAGYSYDLAGGSLGLSLGTPSFPWLRLGGGVELVSLSATASGSFGSGSTSERLFGPFAEIEGRLPLGRLTAFLAARASHHRSTGVEGENGPAFIFPTWTFSSSLGLELGLR